MKNKVLWIVLIFILLIFSVTNTNYAMLTQGGGAQQSSSRNL